MPTIKKLYTLSEVKTLIEKDSGFKNSTVEIFDNNKLVIENSFGQSNLDDNSFTFQISDDR